MARLRWTMLVGAMAVLVVTAVIVASSHGVPEPSAFWPLIAAAGYGPLWLMARRKIVSSGWDMTDARIGLAFLAGLLPLALNVPYLYYRTGSVSASEIDFLPTGFTIAAEVFLGALLLLFVLRLLAPSKETPLLDRMAAKPSRVLVPVGVFWLIAGTVLSILMHRYMHENGPNTTMVVQGLSNIFDDQGPLYAKVLQAEGSSILGVHANFVFFLLYPFYLLVPRYETILFLGQLAMVAALFPFYRLCRTVLDERISLLAALVFITNPVIAGSAATQDMSELRFLAFPLLMSLYFYQKKRFAPFAVFALLAIIVREDVGLLFLLLGLYALFTRRSWQWSLVPMVFGGSWFVIMSNAVIPHFNPAGKFTRLEVVYEEYGGTQLGLIKHLALHPWDIFRRIFANASTIGLTYGLWQTTGLGVPLITGMIILVFPGMAELLLLESGTRPSINSHHAIIIAVPLLAAMVFGISRLDRWVVRLKSFPRERATLVAVTLILFASISAFHVWLNPDRYQPRYNYDRARELVDRLPADAAVIVPMYLLIHTGTDQEAVGYYQIAYRVDLDLEILQEDFIIVDTVIPEGLEGFRVYTGLAAVRDALAQSDEFELVSSADDLKLYVRTEAIPRLQ